MREVARQGSGGAGEALHLTSMGVDRVTVGELRLRAQRTWGGSWRWLVEAEAEEAEEAEVEGEAPEGAAAPEMGEEVEADAPAAEVLAPSSVS